MFTNLRQRLRARKRVAADWTISGAPDERRARIAAEVRGSVAPRLIRLTGPQGSLELAAAGRMLHGAALRAPDPGAAESGTGGACWTLSCEGGAAMPPAGFAEALAALLEGEALAIAYEAAEPPIGPGCAPEALFGPASEQASEQASAPVPEPVFEPPLHLTNEPAPTRTALTPDIVPAPMPEAVPAPLDVTPEVSAEVSSEAATQAETGAEPPVDPPVAPPVEPPAEPDRVQVVAPVAPPPVEPAAATPAEARPEMTAATPAAPEPAVAAAPSRLAPEPPPPAAGRAARFARLLAAGGIRIETLRADESAAPDPALAGLLAFRAAVAGRLGAEPLVVLSPGPAGGEIFLAALAPEGAATAEAPAARLGAAIGAWTRAADPGA